MDGALEPNGAEATAAREKNRVAITSVAAAVLLTGTKLVVGLSTGSLGILSEAAHSGLDLVAAVITVLAVRASAKPADAGHPYGHGKFENLSALAETLLLLGTCVWIIWEALHRLFAHQVHVEANAWAFGVVALSIVVDIGRSRALMKAARKYRSQALEADALHFSTDIWSSCVVLFGLSLVWLSARLHEPWLVRADALAALVVAGIVVWVSLQLGRKTLDDLLDAAPPDLAGQVRDAAAAVPGVLGVGRIRLRRTGGEWFSDLTIQVDPGLPIGTAHALAHQVENAIQQVTPGADVVVHVEPAAMEEAES